MSFEERSPEDQRFEQILTMDGLTIQSFHQQNHVDLFPNATSYPQFFSQNLVNPNRVLKQFLNDPQSNIRIFYFQLLRLAFEVPTQSGHNHVCLQNFKKIVFHPEFEILFTPDTQSQRQIYNDFQFKKLFAEFISLLITASQSEPPSIQQAIDQFPIMDVVLIHIIRSLIVSFNIKVAFDQKIQTDLLFKELSSVLQLSLTSYGNCWKFQESDMFCYEQSDQEIFMAYIADEVYVDDQTNLQVIESVHNEQRSNQNQETPNYDPNLTNSNNNKQQQQFTTPDYPAPNYITYDPQQENKQWSNQLYNNNQIYGKQVNTRYSQQPETVISTSIPQYKNYQNQRQFEFTSLNSQPTVFSTDTGNYKNNEDSRIEQMFSKIDSTLNNIHQGMNEQQQIQTYNNVPSSRTYDEQNTGRLGLSTEIYQSEKYQTQRLQTLPYKHTTSHVPPQNNTYFSYGQNKYVNQYQTFDSNQNQQYNYKSSFSYETSNNYSTKFETTDYNQDFTGPEILSKLRPDNRQNISRIKEYFRNLRRGGQIPQGFDLTSSVIRAVSNVETRNYGKQQYQSRPFSTNIKSGKIISTTYSNQSYSSFYN